MFTAAMVAALVPQALKQLEQKQPAALASVLHDSAVPYLTNPRHRTLLAQVLVATAEKLQPGCTQLQEQAR